MTEDAPNSVNSQSPTAQSSASQANDPQAQRLSSGFGDDFSDLSALQPALSEPTQAPAKVTAKAKSEPKPEKPKPIKPRQKSSPKRKSDAVAKAHGFTSREPVQPVLLKKRRRVQHDEPVDQLSIRGPVRVLNGFIDYCDANKLSYWEALEQLIEETQSSSH